MNNSLINAAISMNGLQQKLDTIANNIANVNTDGFKKKEVSFIDILTSTNRQLQAFQLPGRLTPNGMNQGWGSRISQVQINMKQGNFQPTNQPLDMAIEGNGLFELGIGQPDANGNVVYTRAWTRNGAFKLATNPGNPENLFLVTADGHRVMNRENNPIQVPVNHKLIVDAAGNILAKSELDPQAEPINLGQFKMVGVMRPQLLENIGENLFVLPEGIIANNTEDEVLVDLDTYNASGAAPIGVRQGSLEQSNVDLSVEMAELISAQRAYQLSSRAVSSSDTMMNLANNLRG
ncbi:MAG TPA: flagellar hook-basal body protein [Bacilli bacterium]